MAGPYQAIKFVMLDFDKGWDRIMLVTGYVNIRRLAQTLPCRSAR